MIAKNEDMLPVRTLYCQMVDIHPLRVEPSGSPADKAGRLRLRPELLELICSGQPNSLTGQPEGEMHSIGKSFLRNLIPVQ
jgi:hypothetical protein